MGVYCDVCGEPLPPNDESIYTWHGGALCPKHRRTRSRRTSDSARPTTLHIGISVYQGERHIALIAIDVGTDTNKARVTSVDC